MLSCLFSCRKRALGGKVLLRGVVDFISHLTQRRLVAKKNKQKKTTTTTKKSNKEDKVLY